MVPNWKRVLTLFFGFKTPDFFWLAYLIPLAKLRVPMPYGQPPWKFSCPLSYSRPASGTLLLQNISHIPLLLVSTLRSWPLALLLLCCSDPSALTADTGYPSGAMQTHSRDPALLSSDQFLAIPGHCPPWEGPHLKSWGHGFCRDRFCLLKICYLVVGRWYHWLALSLCLFS